MTNDLHYLIQLIVEQEFKTKQGDQISLSVSEDHEGDNNRGWTVHRVEAKLGNKPVGYLNMSYIPQERFDSHYPSIADYVDKIGGYQSAEERFTPKQMQRKFGRDFQDFKAFHIDKPLVDYIRVDEDYQRRRIGIALYQYGAKWLAGKGMKLYASGLQSDKAKAAWEWLKKNRGAKIGTEDMMYAGKKKTRTFLSY